MTEVAGANRSRRQALILLSMTVANAMVLVDQTAVPLILPSIIQDFRIGSQTVQWVVTGSLLPLAGLLVLGGRLSDLLGRRRVFIAGSALFAGASVCAGLAPDFPVLLVFRALQGTGGALMLPTTIAIVSAAYSTAGEGRALGTMGGAAAIAGACGPVIGGGLTTAFGWRSVLLVNAPLAVLAILVALRAVPPDPSPTAAAEVDIPGAVVLSVALIGLVFGLTQSQAWGWTSPGVIGPLVVSVVAAVSFAFVERRSANPLVQLSLLRRHPNYAGATVSQFLAGMMEMGLGVLLPLLLILNLGMSPGMAGLALLPTTLPMVAVAPLAGRWYDRRGGRLPLTVGFGVLVVAALLLAAGVRVRDYWLILPGLMVFGVGLALVLTVNDPVSIDTVPEKSTGEASGVSATAEQFGGAVGISVLYLLFHTTYVAKLTANIDASPLPDLDPQRAAQLKAAIVAAEQTGLNPTTFDPTVDIYLLQALDASIWGFVVAFLACAVLAVVGLVFVWRLVREPVTAGGAPSVDT